MLERRVLDVMFFLNSPKIPSNFSWFGREVEIRPAKSVGSKVHPLEVGEGVAMKERQRIFSLDRAR